MHRIGTSETYRDVCSGGGYRGMSGLLVDIANPSRLTRSGPCIGCPRRHCVPLENPATDSGSADLTISCGRFNDN